jgi:DUF1680 family protein
MTINKVPIKIDMQTNYPWDGNVRIKLDPAKKTKTKLHIRIPGWARGIAVPGNLYSFVDSSWSKPALLINGKAVDYAVDKGYAMIDREWKQGDQLEFHIEMPVKTVASRKEVAENEGRIAFQRGPLVYCMEGADNNGRALNLIADGNPSLSTEKGSVLDEPVVMLKGTMTAVEISQSGTSIETTKKNVTAIPYYTWCNRGSNEMQVWLPTFVKSVRVSSR